MRLDSQHAGPEVRGVVSRAPTTTVTLSLRPDQLSEVRLTDRLWKVTAEHSEQHPADHRVTPADAVGAERANQDHQTTEEMETTEQTERTEKERTDDPVEGKEPIEAKDPTEEKENVAC